MRSTPAPACPKSSGSRHAAYARVPAPGAQHYENFPVASRLLPTRHAPAHRGDLRVCAHRRRLRRRGRPAPATCGSRCSTTGWRDPRCTRPLRARRSVLTTRTAAAQVFLALGRHDAARAICEPAALRRPAERVPAGRRRCTATRRGPTCSTTAGARPIRSAGWCCASPATDDAARRSRVRRRLHGAAADELLAGPRPRLARRPPLRSARRILAAAGADRRRSRRRSDDAGLARCAAGGRGAEHARALRARPAVCRRGQRPPALGAARDVARRHAHPRSARAGSASTSSRAGRRSRSADAPRHRLAHGRWSWRHVSRDDQLLLLVSRAAAAPARAPSSPSSTSAARSTTASTRPGDRAWSQQPRPSLAGWRAELDAVLTAAAPATPQGRRLQPFVAALPAAARAIRRARRRRRDGPRPAALRDVRRALQEYCHRVASTVGLICVEIFGSAIAQAARLRARPRRRAAADEHPARRRTWTSNAAACTCRRTTSRGSAARDDDLGRDGSRPPRSRARWRSESGRARASLLLRARRRAGRHRTPRPLVAAEIMRAIYRETLARIEAASYDVLLARDSRAAGRRVAIAASTWFGTRLGRHVAGLTSSSSAPALPGSAPRSGSSSAGARVVVVEERRRLGGRATAFTDRATGERVDNGQHVLFGCYRETFAFPADDWRRGPRRARRAARRYRRRPRSRRVAAGDLRPGRRRLHLVGGLLSWRRLGGRDRLAAAEAWALVLRGLSSTARDRRPARVP